MKAVFIVLALLVQLPDSAVGDDKNDDHEKLQVALEMLQSWEDKDWDAVINSFADDGVFHNMMAPPIVGKEAIRNAWQVMFDSLESIEMNVRTQGVIQGMVVLERLDTATLKTGQSGSIPIVGILDIQDGKIREWRDYYDLNSLLKIMQEPATKDNSSPDDS